jgi:hypothetical protein
MPYRSFDVPMFFLLGRYDWHVPAVLAEQYFEMIEAPCKRLVWFEQSAHNPPFEEPEKFNQVLIEEVLPFSTGVDSRTCSRHADRKELSRVALQEGSHPCDT